MQNENKAYPMSRLLEEKSACPRQKTKIKFSKPVDNMA